jgi:hypothetical protein
MSLSRASGVAKEEYDPRRAAKAPSGVPRHGSSREVTWKQTDRCTPDKEKQSRIFEAQVDSCACRTALPARSVSESIAVFAVNGLILS